VQVAPVPLAFTQPTSIDLEPAGTLLLVENNPGRLLRIDPGPGRTTAVIPTLTRPYAVVRAASGDLLLSAESRLSDVVVFANDPARGRGPLAEAFQQVLADEQRPVLIAREGLKVGGVVAVAWDGGKEASRAARLAMPLLEKAERGVILAAPKASSRSFDPSKLQAYYAARGVKTEVELLPEGGDPAPALLKGARAAGADILVAGAFGHPRLQEFIFGGTTRTLLNSDQPSLFLSH